MRIRALAPRSRVLAVVKANAYGHGLVDATRALAAADGWGVARLEEALALRAAAVTGPILLMEGVLEAQGLAEVARHDLQLVVHSEEQLALLECAPPGQPLVVWLKIDTGMNRLGFRGSQLPRVRERLQGLGPRLAELRLMTHFASADEPDQATTREQLARFAALTGQQPNARSLANSAAIFQYPQSHADWVRPGLALYGVSPFATRSGAELGLVPAMRLFSTVLAVREVKAGEAVGYGGAWRATRDSRIATVAAGYADGLLRAVPDGTPVLINDLPAPLVGRVSMDMITVDVTPHPAVRAGDTVLLWGPELPVEQLAARAGTIAYELLSAVAERVPRVMAWQ